MIQLAPSDTRFGYFLTRNGSQATVAPDALPTVTVYKNGAVQGSITPAVTLVSTGRYSYTWNVPSNWVGGDQISEVITWAVSSTNYGSTNEAQIAAVDSMSIWRALGAVVAVLMGKVTQSGNVQSFAARDGSTVLVQVTVGTAGTRTASTVN